MMGTSHELTSDLLKVLNEWALASGRSLQSEQTGFVHYYYGETGSANYHTIPLVENSLFILALLRSRLIDNIQEAKTLLKRLLAFQPQQASESLGNFPLYVHDYPSCQDSTVALQLLAPFYGIIKHFGHVLGADLRQQLEQAASRALEFSLRMHTIKPFSYAFEVRLAAAQKAYGELWERSDWIKEGEKNLEQLSIRQLEDWYTTKQLGDMLIGLQMVYTSIQHSPWNLLWKRLDETWHQATGCYVGPCLREWQEREEPQPHVYDLYAGYFAKQFARRATVLRPYHLYAALIQPSTDQFGTRLYPLQVSGKVKQQTWRMVSDSTWCYTVLEKKNAAQPSVDKTYTPFRLVWGDLQLAHSFVCQGGRYEQVTFACEEQKVQLSFQLGDEIPQEREKSREIEFFVDFHPDVRFSLDHLPHAATTFELGQNIHLNFGRQRLSLVFSLLEGEGDFLGHLMRGNRPSQIDHKGEKRFHAYDWTFFLRTIRRQGPCRVQATLTIENLAVETTSESLFE